MSADMADVSSIDPISVGDTPAISSDSGDESTLQQAFEASLTQFMVIFWQGAESDVVDAVNADDGSDGG
jgi:hypothetical protein